MTNKSPQQPKESLSFIAIPALPLKLALSCLFLKPDVRVDESFSALLELEGSKPASSSSSSSSLSVWNKALLTVTKNLFLPLALHFTDIQTRYWHYRCFWEYQKCYITTILSKHMSFIFTWFTVFSGNLTHSSQTVNEHNALRYLPGRRIDIWKC